MEDLERRETGEDLLQAVDAAADRLQQGIHLLSNQAVFDAFRIANRAMAAAARQREAQKRRTDPRARLDPESVPAPAWRPFQLAFVLLNLRVQRLDHCGEECRRKGDVRLPGGLDGLPGLVRSEPSYRQDPLELAQAGV